MEKDLPGPMTPFDELVTSPELQLIKLMIPYAPASGRQMLAAFVHAGYHTEFKGYDVSYGNDAGTADPKSRSSK